MNPDQPARPGSANQPRQQCLRLIVGRMRHRDFRATPVAHQLLEKRITRPPPGILKIPMIAPRQRSHILARRKKWHV